VLLVVEVKLMLKAIRKGPEADMPDDGGDRPAGSINLAAAQ